MRFMPYMMVQASKTTEIKLAGNNLSPAEFLRPFGEVGNLGGYTLRTSDRNESVKLQNFSVNFIDSSLMTMDSKGFKFDFSKCRPKQDDTISTMTRDEAQDSLMDLVGPTRIATEMA
jgi:hypothetical protein